MKNLLGGKGANLAEMNLIGIPVPPGFTITTEACTEYNTLGAAKLRDLLMADVQAAVKHVEQIMGMQFGSNESQMIDARQLINLFSNNLTEEGVTFVTRGRADPTRRGRWRRQPPCSRHGGHV